MPAQLTLSQLTDLALGTPEVGACNFNVLHTLLHAMIKQLKITDVKADINETDRDFLASSKQRALSQWSLYSDKDSGKGETDTEDTLSEKSGVQPARTPYHQLEIKVEKLAEQLEQLNSLPSNEELFDRTKPSSKTDQSGERPVSDMWQTMQLKKRVDANEEGVGKLMSLMEDMMKELTNLKASNNELMDKIRALNMGDLLKKLKDLEKKTNELNEKFSQLPSPDEFAQFVTWPGLEDALKGVRQDLENMQPPERVVIEMSSQTEPPSRPASSRPLSRVSNASSGPSSELLEILERLGKLSEDHQHLTKRVDDIEEELKNKVDKEALENLSVPADLLETLNQMKLELEALQKAREKDTDALNKAQQAIQQLQEEVEKLHNTTKDIIEENSNRTKQIEELFQECEKLQDTKADKEFVQMEVDVKADKRSLDCKVNHTVFDTTTNEINKMIQDILDKLAAHDEDWKNSYRQLNEDIDGKLDRLELDPLKEWLEARLKALNSKIKATQPDWNEDDAAGIRKQLVQRFHCISCDRPVEMLPTGPVPSLPTHQGLPPTRSPRPYTTFELDQIRQHAKRLYNGQAKPGARFAPQDQQEVNDYYATPRPCGGGHTMTYPHKRITRLTHLSHLFREDDGGVFPLYKEEVDVQGADGHIYRGRMHKMQLEAKLPTTIGTAVPAQQTKSPVNRPQTVNQPRISQYTSDGRGHQSSPPPQQNIQRPGSARASPRPASRQGSRPQSAHPAGSRQGTPGPESSRTTPVPPESPRQVIDANDEPEPVIEVPTTQ